MLLKGIIPVLFAIFVFSACRKDQQILKGPGTMNFSEDTVYFDTVFTRLVGSPYPRSINKRFMIRNPYKENVNMNIRLMGGSSSPYRMNVDGRTGVSFQEVEILSEDSAWVFVEATLEPNFLTHPALVRDSIQFETNGNIQYVQLAAYGWDAYYFKDSVITSSTSLILTDKPYVIVNAMVVDTGTTLTIGPGIHFYCTPNSTVVRPDGTTFQIGALTVLGTLKVNGNKDNPVIFEGDRLDNNYADKPGQWRGLYFARGSINNEIRHAVIKNASTGIRVDSLPESGTYSLIVRNTIIKNISSYGILGLTAKIYVENTAISSCGSNTVLMYWGGDYTFIHCSFHSNAKDAHVIANNILRDENKNPINYYDLKYTFANSIIWRDGEKDSDATFDDVNESKVLSGSGYFGCLLRSKNPLTVRRDPVTIFNKDPKFDDASKNKLKILAGSAAKDAGINLGLSSDLEEKPRDSKPDMGAYEL